VPNAASVLPFPYTKQTLQRIGRFVAFARGTEPITIASTRV
jgi:hypothetical protein